MGEKMDLIDLSPFPKCSFTVEDLGRVAKHMEKFPRVERIEKVVSCYRASQEDHRFKRRGVRFVTSDRASDSLSRQIQECLPVLFFPVWMLLGLIPKEKGRWLTVGNVAVAQLEKKDTFDFGWIIDGLKELEIRLGQGELFIENLTVVCKDSNVSNIDALKAELSRIGITFGSCKVKVIYSFAKFNNKYFEHYFKRICTIIRAGHELKIMIGEDRWGNKLDIKDILDRIPSDCPLDWLEDDELAAEITELKDIYESPHTMFGSCYMCCDSDTIPFDFHLGDRILLATLGHGCTPDPTMKNVLDHKNFTLNETAPVFHSSSWQIKGNYTSPFVVVCQTTSCNDTIANGATAKAINWLTKNWKREWKERYDNLVVLIPYGGQYMEDEMIEISRASNEGIVIVCAAGTSGRGVVFPAALGTVISVGIDDEASGREIDIHVPKSSLINDFRHRLGSMYDEQTMEAWSVGCGTAAAKITISLSIFLSHVNFILKSTHHDPICQQMVNSIKRYSRIQYLHTCVIRELLVNEGNGSHDPLLGYGDGEKMFRHLIKCETGLLLAKMSRVLLKKSGEEIKVIEPKDDTFRLIPISDETRKDVYHDLTGSGVKVAVIDQEFRSTPWSRLWKDHHGEICSKVIENIAPDAIIKPILDAGAIVPSLNECKDDSSVSIISCSMDTESFDLQVFKAVNEAVIAGKILVFSAGNKGRKSRNAILYPGRIGNVLVIGGQDPFYSHLSFSSVGKEIDFLAPAEYGGHKGTSYAAPAIAGHIALLLEFVKRMSEEDYRIMAWSRSSDSDKYKWLEISIWKAVRNVYAMRDLLKLFVTKPQPHSEILGFGCIDFSVLFQSYRVRPDIDVTSFIAAEAKKLIHERLQVFYCRDSDSVKITSIIVYSLDALFSNMHI